MKTSAPSARLFLFSVLLAAVLLLVSCTRAENPVPETFPGTVPDASVSPVWTMGYASEAAYPANYTKEPYYIAGFRHGVPLSGVAEYDVYDYPRASAVWMDAGGEGVLLIGVDCIGLSVRVTNDIRTDLAAFCAETGCAAVHVFATNNHAGIDTLGLWGPDSIDGKQDDYIIRLTEACSRAARRAYEARTPGQLYYGAAETDLLTDTRAPVSFDAQMHQFRFAGEDGSGIRLVSYAASPDTLGPDNTRLSRDFPGILGAYIREQTGDALLYMPAAVGSVRLRDDLPADDTPDSPENRMIRTGRLLADTLLSIRTEEEIQPLLRTARTELVFPVDNPLYLYDRFLGIRENPAERDGSGETGYSMRSELSVLTLGDCTFLLCGGELFPELVTGDFLSAAEAASPAQANPAPLAAIAAQYGHHRLFVLSFANDSIGCILPPHDFLLDFCVHPDRPELLHRRFYGSPGQTAEGQHREEPDSPSPAAARVLAEAFRSLLEAMQSQTPSGGFPA